MNKAILLGVLLHLFLYFLNPTGWAKPLENGFIPPLDGSDGDVGVRGNNGQDTDKTVRVLRLGGSADYGSQAGSSLFTSPWARSFSDASVGFFTTVKLD